MLEVLRLFIEKIIKDEKAVFIDADKKMHEIKTARIFEEGVILYGK